MKFTVVGLIQCMAEVEVDAETFEDAIEIAKEKCLNGNPLDEPLFDIESIERRYDLEEPEEDEVAARIADNESCSHLKEEVPVSKESKESSEDSDDVEAALNFIKNLWKPDTDPKKWFRHSDTCKPKCKGKCRHKNITVYDTNPFFWDFD